MKPYVYKPNCYCSSYKFPHRVGSGKCDCEEVPTFHFVGLQQKRDSKVCDLCESCGQPSDTQIVDYGIGAHEYWGSFAVHRDEQEVSCCCEAPMIENSQASADAHRKEWFNG